MAAPCKYWLGRYDAGTQKYQCCGDSCNRDLKAKVSNSPKNPGRVFVSCSKDFGGCGMFCFLDEEPRFFGNKNGGAKRARDEGVTSPRAGGSNIVGPIVNTPTVTDERLADLAAKVDVLATKLEVVLDYIKQVTEN